MKFGISILYPVHKNSDYIEHSLESILKQSYIFFEIIILIDGKNHKLINYFESNYSSEINKKKIILYISDKQVGLTKILNMGIKISNYPYIARNDYDDISNLNRLYLQIDEFKKNTNLKMVYSYFSYIDSNDDILRLKKAPNPKKIINKIKFKNPIAHSSVMFKKDYIINLGLYNEEFEVSQDFELWSKIINDSVNNVSLVKKNLVSIRIDENSVSSQHSLAQRKNSIKICLNNFLQSSSNNSQYSNFDHQSTYKDALETAYIYERKIKWSLSIFFYYYLFKIFLNHPSLLYKRIRLIL